MNTEDQGYMLEPLVEIMKYSQVNDGDVLILRCENGKENEEILKMHTKLRSLIHEKNLRILALTPDFDTERLYNTIHFAKNFNESDHKNSEE